MGGRRVVVVNDDDEEKGAKHRHHHHRHHHHGHHHKKRDEPPPPPPPPEPEREESSSGAEEESSTSDSASSSSSSSSDSSSSSSSESESSSEDDDDSEDSSSKSKKKKKKRGRERKKSASRSDKKKHKKRKKSGKKVVASKKAKKSKRGKVAKRKKAKKAAREESPEVANPVISLNSKKYSYEEVNMKLHAISAILERKKNERALLESQQKLQEKLSGENHKASEKDDRRAGSSRIKDPPAVSKKSHDDKRGGDGAYRNNDEQRHRKVERDQRREVYDAAKRSRDDAPEDYEKSHESRKGRDSNKEYRERHAAESKNGSREYDRPVKDKNDFARPSNDEAYAKNNYHKNDRYDRNDSKSDSTKRHGSPTRNRNRDNYSDNRQDNYKRPDESYEEQPRRRPYNDYKYDRDNQSSNSNNQNKPFEREEPRIPTKRRYDERHSDNRDEPSRKVPPQSRNALPQKSTDRDRADSGDRNRPSTSFSRGERKRPWDEDKEAGNYEWGKRDKADPKKDAPKVDKEKPNFGLSGKLTEDTNTVNGVVLKYSEPSEGRKPKRRWRFYPFKGETALPIIYIHRQSFFLMGRDRMICDIKMDHPSISNQHAVLQYRLVPFTRDDGSTGKRVRPYLIDLGSSNGTFVNNKPIEPSKYVELLERDVIKFGYSEREYVLLHENSKEEDGDMDDDDVKPNIKSEDSPPLAKVKTEPK